jgi:hypothetical protein
VNQEEEDEERMKISRGECRVVVLLKKKKKVERKRRNGK